MSTTSARTVIRIRPPSRVELQDQLVTEEPVEFRLGDVPIAVVMRTPGHDEDLARGFALTEGIIIRPDELAAVRIRRVDDEGARYDLVLAEGVTVDPEQFRRNLFATSSCGVCGKASIDSVRVAARIPPPGPVLDPASMIPLSGIMGAAQDGFAATGGLHAAALFEPDGSLIALREDVGRHNAVDKVVGAVTGDRWPVGEVVLLVSGRVSFEMVQKAAVAGIPVVAGISAASSLAVELGEELGLTVVGFLRENGFNVYSGEQRIR